MAKGGVRPGAGRPSKAQELKVSGFAIAAIVEEYGSVNKFWRHIAKESLESKDHLKMLLEYAYGKPTQQVTADISLKEVIVDFED